MPRRGPNISTKHLLFCRALEDLRLIDWSTKIKLIFFLSFMWSSHLDRGVNCERKDAKEEAVEHAEDWGATVVRVLLGTWGKVLLDWLLTLRLGLGLGSGCPQGFPGDLGESHIGHLGTCNECRANCIEIGQINSTLPSFQSFKHYGNLNLRWRQADSKSRAFVEDYEVLPWLGVSRLACYFRGEGRKEGGERKIKSTVLFQRGSVQKYSWNMPSATLNFFCEKDSLNRMYCIGQGKKMSTL